MRFRNPLLTLAFLSLVAGAAQTLSAQGEARTDVTNTGTHLVMNGVVAMNDQNETDFYCVDIDLDGDWDIVAGRKTPFTSAVSGLPNMLLINDGLGQFTDMTSTYTNWATTSRKTREVKARDMNNDGWPDVIFFNTENDPTAIYVNLGNNASGDWLGMSPTPTTIGTTVGPFNFCGGEVWDYDGDGFMDLYRVNYNSGSNPTTAGDDLLRQDPANPLTFILSNSVFPTNGSTLFTAQQSFGTRAQAILDDGSIMDLNGDGWADLKIAGSGHSKAAFSDGLGGFSGWRNLDDVGSTYDSNAGDFDNDGLIDILKIKDGLDSVYYNQGNDASGMMIESTAEVIGAGSVSNGFGANPAVIDFDGDGDLDIFVVPIDVDISNCGTSTTSKLYINTGSSPGRFQVSTALTLMPSIFDVATKDFDGDGLPDLLYSGCNGTGYRLLLSDPNAQADLFRSEFIPNGGGLDFTVSDIPVHSGNFRALYNLFSTDLSQPAGSGPFIGMPGDVLSQIGAGPPFANVIGPGQDSYTYFIPPVVVNLGLDVRMRSVAIDPGLGMIDLTDITDVLGNP